MSVEIEGLEGLIDGLGKILDPQKFKQSMKKACVLVEGEAKKKAPKDEGALRRSITSDVSEENGEIVGVVFTPLEYAPYREFGTGLFAEEGNGRKDVPWHYQDDKGEWHSTNGMKPHPFLRPALEENRENIKRILKEGISDD